MAKRADRYTIERRLHATELLLATLHSESLVVHRLMTGALDRALPERTAQWYVARARERIDEAAAKDRHRARADALRRLRALYEAAVMEGELGAAAAVNWQITALDGSRAAAAEAEEPTLLERAEAAAARVLDYEPAPRPDLLPAYGETEKRWRLRRLLLLAERASDTAAAFRGLGPIPQDQSGRRLWIQRAQALSIQQGATAAALAPERRREGIHRGAAAYAMLTRDADVADQLDRLEQEEALAPAPRARR